MPSVGTSSNPSSPESVRGVSPIASRRARESDRRPSHASSYNGDLSGSPRSVSAHPYAASVQTSPARRRSPRSSTTPLPHDSSTSTSTATQGGRTRTKSVLAIALSKANQAVELDEANDVQGAIDAYTESVGLLRDVMARVEQTNAAWRARERDRERAAARRGDRQETEADRERRSDRLAREEARIEESRRLQTIVRCPLLYSHIFRSPGHSTTLTKSASACSLQC
jgi:hypothetical protein